METLQQLATTNAVFADTVLAANFVNPKTINTTTVTVEIDRPLSAIDSSKFTVNGAAATSATYINKTLTDTVTSGAIITLTIATPWATDATPAIAVTGANALTTEFGTKNAAIIAVGTAADKTAPGLVATLPVKVTAANTITLTYNENIYAPSVSIYNYTVAGNTVTNASVAGATVTLTLGTALVGTDATAAVTQALAIQDASAAHNSLAASATVLTAADAQSATVTGTLVGIANTAGETIAAAAGTKTLIFSELLSATGKTAVENALKAGVTGVVGTDLGFVWNGATLTVTNNHATTVATFAAAADLTATFTDVAGNTSAGSVLATY